MPRNKLSKLNKMNLANFNVDMEVILMVLLIVVAILLVCYLNRKFKQREEFFTRTLMAMEGKRLYLFYAMWCPHSKSYLHSNNLRNLERRLADENLNGQFQRIDVETTDGGNLAESLEITSLPTMVGVENDTHTILNMNNIDEVIEWLR